MSKQEQLRRVKADNTSGKADARKSWAVVGEKGAVEFWCYPRTDTYEVYGGLEYHARTEKDWASHNDFCQLLDGPCWHTGSSLIVHEHWIPHILPLGDEAIFGALAEYYRDWK